MTPCQTGCPFRRDCPECAWAGGDEPKSRVAQPIRERVRVLAQTSGTPASAATDRGRDHDSRKESR